MPLVRFAENSRTPTAAVMSLPTEVAHAVASLKRGTVIAFRDHAGRVKGILLSSSDYHQLLMAVEQSLNIVDRTVLDRTDESEYVHQREFKVQDRLIPDYLEAAIANLRIGAAIAIVFTAEDSNHPQAILLYPAEYELLRAAEGLSTRSPRYRKMLKEEDAWRETLPW